MTDLERAVRKVDAVMEAIVARILEAWETLVALVSEVVEGIVEWFWSWPIEVRQVVARRCRWCNKLLLLDLVHGTCVFCGGPPRTWRPPIIPRFS